MKTLALLAAFLMPGWLPGAETRFEVAFPASIHADPVTGRLFLVISKTAQTDPILQAGVSGRTQVPFFGRDVNQMAPGEPVALDAAAAGYPLRSLNNLPPGDYWVQALLGVYTQYRRADGKTIYAPGADDLRFSRAPGNLYSEPQRFHLDAAAGYSIKLELAFANSPAPKPADTQWLKHVQLQSPMLTKFWGHPMSLGATVLLPKGYAENPAQRYPVIYCLATPDVEAPFSFRDQPAVAGPNRGRDLAGYQFYRRWDSGETPPVIIVMIDHPTPFATTSYAVNSANNGPYGDAIVKELIPFVEQQFRIVAEPRARKLTGVGPGGWAALALQVFHPDFFNGAWIFGPDPIDLSRYQMIDIYHEDNAFAAPAFPFGSQERPRQRDPDGQVVLTVREQSQLEATLGTRGRSGEQFHAWEAAIGPVGSDGYPRSLWDPQSGKIDQQVAQYMKDHDFDLIWNMESNWGVIGPLLKGKLHFYVGDADNFYLNLGIYRLQDFLDTTDSGATFEYGRRRGAQWYPMSFADLVKVMVN